MDTITEIRRARLEMLIAEAGSLTALARAAGSSVIYLSSVRHALVHAGGRARTLGNAMSRRLERAGGKPLGWLDQPLDADPATPSAPIIHLRAATLSPASIAAGLAAVFGALHESQRRDLAALLSAWLAQGAPESLLPAISVALGAEQIAHPERSKHVK